MVYAYQFFRTESRTGKINLYQFEHYTDRALWLKADLKRYLESDDKYHRQTCSKKDAEILMKFGHRPIKLKASSSLKIKSSVEKSCSYFLNIKVALCPPKPNEFEST